MRIVKNSDPGSKFATKDVTIATTMDRNPLAKKGVETTATMGKSAKDCPSARDELKNESQLVGRNNRGS